MEMNEEMCGEQLEAKESTSQNLVEEVTDGSSILETQSKMEEDETSEAERGVPIGKFKNVDDLLTAYNNLQSEFTRKCQRLSELEKDKTEAKKSEQFDSFNQFLLENQEAYAFADEIKQRVMQDESLQNQEDAYSKVWASMIYEKLSSPNKEQEPLVQNLILKDDKLKNLVIKNYMKQLQDNYAPIVMTSESGERVTKPVAPKPDSFEEAKRIAMELFS